jgi:hypothetical protein
MTVTNLIKKLRQCQGNETIASVRIEYGDGSIYNDPPLARPVSPRRRRNPNIGENPSED